MPPLTKQSAEARCYEFGQFRVDAANRLLLRAGEVVPLTSKVFDILLVFVQNSGRLLDKDEVMREVWPDSFVEEGNLTRNVSTLRKALGESPHEHQYIVTVPGRGYRFVARVRASESNDDALVVEERIRARVVMEEEVEGGDEIARPYLHDSASLVRSAEPAAGAPNLALAVQASTTAAAHPTAHAGQLTGRPAARPITRLMVLPFRMLRADPEVDFLAFSVPDAVAGALSVLDSVVVCSPTGAARYANEILDLKQIAEEARAEAVLTGTILRAGNVIRVTCELLEVPSGTVLWWHEPHVSMSDLFELQDKLVRGIVASLALSLSAREHGRLNRDVPTTAMAYELYLRGNELSRRGLAGFSDLTVARDLYLRCVEADPHYAPAWAQLGRCYRLIGKGMEHGRENFGLAEAAFQRALELNADLPLAHSQYAFLEAELGRATDAVARLLRCARTGSASPDLFVALVLCCRFCGLLEASVAAHERARELDPLIATSVSHTYYQLGDYDSALRHVAVGAWGIMGMTLGTMGRTADGVAAFRNLEQSGMPVPMRAFVGAWRAMLEGNRRESLDAAEQCIQHYLDPEGVFYMGLIMAHLGESERALTVLSECMNRGFSSVHVLLRNPWFEGLRSTAQFNDLIKRAAARFVEADEVCRSAGGTQALGGGLGEALVVEERIRARVVMEAEVEAGRVDEIVAEMARTDLHGSTGLARSGEQAARETGVSLAAQTVTPKAADSTLQQTVRLIMQNPVLLGCVALSVLALAAFYFLSGRPKEAAAARLRMTRLTTTGNSLMAAISPDGQYIGYVKQEGTQQSLRVIQVATNNDVQISAPADIDYRGLTFSPDSNYIYYVMFASVQPEAMAQQPTLYQISILGGATRKVMDGLDSPISFSPDGTQFAFVREDTALRESALLLKQLDGMEEKRLATRKLPDYFDFPAWSPDGQLIACTATGYTNPAQLAFFAVPSGRAVASAAAARTWKHIRNIAWLKDGRGLVLSVGDPERTAIQLWQLAYPDGSARRLTDDLNDNIGVSLTADSNMLVTVQSSSFSSLWLARPADAYRATQVTQNVGYYDRLNWTADNRLVYATSANDRHDLWLLETNGSQPTRLTFDYAANTNLSVSLDGRQLIFVSGDSNRGIWRADVDGSNPTRLMNGRGTADPQVTADNKWVIYTARWADKWSVLWKAPLDGSVAAPLTDVISTHPAISPDGQLIACFYLHDQADTQLTPTSIALIPLAGGPPVKIFNIPPAVNQAAGLRWTADGLALTYVDNHDGPANIFSQPIDGGSPQQLTDFTDKHIFSFAWSRDEQQLALARGVIVSDIVLLRNFR